MERGRAEARVIAWLLLGAGLVNAAVSITLTVLVTVDLYRGFTGRRS